MTFVLAFLTRRWVIVLVPGVIWGVTTVYLRRNNGWHGFGWGEFGVLLNVSAAVIALVAVPLGIGVRALTDALDRAR